MRLRQVRRGSAGELSPREAIKTARHGCQLWPGPVSFWLLHGNKRAHSKLNLWVPSFHSGCTDTMWAKKFRVRSPCIYDGRTAFIWVS